MDGHDLQLEEGYIPLSTGLSFHGFDFVVGAFQRSCGYGTNPNSQILTGGHGSVDCEAPERISLYAKQAALKRPRLRRIRGP